MHMADALLSPAVGGTMWAAAAAAITLCSQRVKRDLNDRKVPLMGVLGAFVFAVQMINFAIPGTGSSGHLGGGMLLAILLGPAAALITIASVLTVQALFFADGGLLALGCNIFNLGIIPCFVAYPLLYRTVAGGSSTRNRIAVASILASVVGLQFGAFAVVLETFLSGISALPFRSFIMVMQPVHLAIGIVEGVVTAMVVRFIWKAQPEILGDFSADRSGPLIRTRLLAGFLGAALVVGGGLSWFASPRPDGLEWSIFRVAGDTELTEPGAGVHLALGGLQQRTSFLPGYGFRIDGEEESGVEEGRAWPGVDAGSTVSAVAGGAATLAIVFGVGWVLRKRNGS
jgi:cobalt/nickel transport system permease protein